jgi:N-acylglucosamine 2-epimerase
MNERMRKLLLGFYQNELTNNILSFWLPRCEDKTYGGYLNCFTNSGDRLVSRDKYTWSQGRFVWMFSKLSGMPMFKESERAEFLRLAGVGARFLTRHCLVNDGGPVRCTFLTDETGAPKSVAPGAPLDQSIYADCFVIAGLGKYAAAARNEAVYTFAKTLYTSAVSLWRSGNFRTLPYPLTPKYRAHGLPMIFQNVARELHDAAVIFDPDFAAALVRDADACSNDILTHFTDEHHLIREVIYTAGGFIPSYLGQHINPGHTIEDIWFHLDTADLSGHPERLGTLSRIALATLDAGWDSEYGGILHYAGLSGGMPTGDYADAADEPMLQQTVAGWGDKLWWVHAEALYTTLRLYILTNDARFLDWHGRIFDYTFATFPNPDRELREWIQIRKRDGSPQDKVVALPVKDPYHITRNLALIIDLLENAE